MKLAVRSLSLHCRAMLFPALILILAAHLPSCVAGATRSSVQQPSQQERWGEDIKDRERWRRYILEEDDDGDGDGDGDENNNCSSIDHVDLNIHNSTCDFVREECDGKYDLFNYLAFAVCDLRNIKVREYNISYII